ncbi:MAG: hypothetical protein WA001_03185 [Patescibacteria group bacterium]
MPHGHFIQIDGIDGAGKSTLLSTAREWVEGRGLKAFNTIEFCKREKRLPTFEEVQDSDVLFTAEPTHAGIGDVIRNEIIQANAPYDTRFTAHAFALDRGVQYRRVVLPFLAAKPNGWVIQDRGLLSSLAYQPHQSAEENVPVTVSELLELPGNKIALERVPDVFVFLSLDATIAQQRLAQRTDKQDNDRFSSVDFQTALAARYTLPEVTDAYTSRGTQIRLIDGAKSKDEVAMAMRQLLEGIASRV